MRKIGIFFCLLFFFLLIASPLSAAKRRVRVARGGISYSQARLSRPTNSVVLTLLNLSQIAKVTYTLSYTANGIEQGVVGSFIPSGQGSDSRDLYFGTCSKGVCTPHYNIRNAALLVSTTLKSGTVNLKRYRLKI